MLWELVHNKLPFEGMSNLQAAYAAAFKVISFPPYQIRFIITVQNQGIPFIVKPKGLESTELCLRIIYLLLTYPNSTFRVRT